MLTWALCIKLIGSTGHSNNIIVLQLIQTNKPSKPNFFSAVLMYVCLHSSGVKKSCVINIRQICEGIHQTAIKIMINSGVATNWMEG